MTMPVPKVLYPLEEIMLLVLCGQLVGADGFVETVRWGAMNVDFLRQFRAFVFGVPNQNALSDLFNALDAEAFRDAFIAFAESLRTPSIPAPTMGRLPKSLLSTARPRGAPARRPRAAPSCIVSPPERPNNASCSARRRSTATRTKSWQYRASWTCWT
jgi:hypothetical protein